MVRDESLTLGTRLAPDQSETSARTEVAVTSCRSRRSSRSVHRDTPVREHFLEVLLALGRIEQLEQPGTSPELHHHEAGSELASHDAMKLLRWHRHHAVIR